MAKNTILQPAPNLAQQPRVDFDKAKFDALVWAKGNDVDWERAIECPCKSAGGPNLSSCTNCHGIGWIFTDLVETKMVIQSINRNTKVKSWSLELLGTMGVTALAENSLGFMDRITVKSVTAIYNQVVFTRISYQSEYFAFTVYPIIEVLYAGLFNGLDNPLIQLTEDQYEIRDGYIVFDVVGMSVDTAITLRYVHYPTYNILDMQREVMGSYVIDKAKGGRDAVDDFPIHAVARRSQYVFDAENLAGNLNSDNNIGDSMGTPGKEK